MILFRYLARELFKAQLTVLAVLMLIFLSREFVSVLTKAAEGKFPADLVTSLVLLNLPGLILMILPLSMFLGILIALGRMYAESEMVVLRACGVSEWYVARVTLAAAIFLGLIGGATSLYLKPWAEEQQLQLLEDADASAGLSTLVAGQFKQTFDGKSVVFVEKMSRDGRTLFKVFLAQTPSINERHKNFSIVVSDMGSVQEAKNQPSMLVLNEGTRWEGHPRRLDYHIVDFEEYQVLLKEFDVDERGRKIDAWPLAKLFEDGSTEAKAEIQWRLAVPLSIPILALIAVPLAAVNPRQGKFAKMLPAILLYLGYYVLLMSGHKALEDGALPASLGLWWIHALAASFGAVLIMRGRPIGVRLVARLKGMKG
ncbi:LPS export ABC transporter permease LptF [Corallincola spongiicola]|uniref:Lipopolysaccharide export system permease protein LptF n=1 Tax=Corallincola spongiicola TaxID=2520508 RepID=A0ABY1WRB4_9GAMM|nr:LPS export ABC transporter permease LptF [Corallincola spongiicola]TAA47258.1 LPS export ABC transporter permease LptF [Corallincola spongiicola]